jgi:AraC family transcriptional regulator
MLHNVRLAAELRVTEPPYKVAPESLECIRAIKSARQESSRDVGWTSLLLDLHWLAESREDYPAIVTPDQLIGASVSGTYGLDVHMGGRWHSSIRQPGSVGMARGGEPVRERLTIAPRAVAGVAVLYLPHEELYAASEHTRRVGQISRAPGLNVIVERDAAISQMISNLTQAMRRGVDNLYAETASAWLTTHLMSCHGTNAGIDDTRSPGVITDARLARVIEMMTVRFSEPLGLDELASEACISKYHFARLFRRTVGVTPLGFLTNIRMETAKRLLRTTDLTVSEIAVACGYPAPVNFTAAFTARHGLSPSHFRSEAWR